MSSPIDPNAPSGSLSFPVDSLEIGLAAGFGKKDAVPSSSGVRASVLLREVDDEASPVVKPKTDAIPHPGKTGERYQLSGEIARGGMGAILRGRDVELGRDLAVKVILEKYANRPEIEQRFIEEAQIAGQLQHPGVVPVYDFGRFGDRLFFTMKLVKGQTLAALLSKRSDLRHDLSRFLGIALHVVQTIAYAHAKGVIHRDLKPANIMVGAFGEVQVMDWGLAKVLSEGGVADEEMARRSHTSSETSLTIRTQRGTGSTGGFGTRTEAGSLLGTPAYMPPEQANGDLNLVDYRADVFGLGAILCEILTGKPPYVGKSPDDVRQKAINADLTEAWDRLDLCGAETELIDLVRYCLAPGIGDRPKDAQAVANRLNQYLEGVQERLQKANLAAVETRTKAKEETKRHKLLFLLASTVTMGILVCGGFGLWFLAENESEKIRINQEVKSSLEWANALNLQGKTKGVDGSPFTAQAREKIQRGLALIDHGKVNPVLVSQIRLLQAQLDQEERDRKLALDLDQARLAQAEIFNHQRRFDRERALPRFREGFEAFGVSPNKTHAAEAVKQFLLCPVELRDIILAALDEWDDLADRSSIPSPASESAWLKAVLGELEGIDPWLRKARAARTLKDTNQRRITLESLAKSVSIEKPPARTFTRLAEQLSPKEAVELLRSAQQKYPGDFWINHDLGMRLEEIKPPNKEDAVRFLSIAAALRPNSPGVQNNLGVRLFNRGLVDEAIATYLRAIDLDPQLAIAHNNLGNALKAKGKLEEGITQFHLAIQLDPKLTMAYYNLANALKDQGQMPDALVQYQKAVEVDPDNEIARQNLGVALVNSKQKPEAIIHFQKALEINSFNAIALDHLGSIFLENGKFQDAANCFRKCIELDPLVSGYHNSLGNALRGMGRVDEAISQYQKAIDRKPDDSRGHYNLGTMLYQKGQLDDAISHYRKATEIEPTYSLIHNGLGLALEAQGKHQQAQICFQKAIELDPKLAMAHGNLGIALQNQNKLDEAIISYKKAIELDPREPMSQNNLGAAYLFNDQPLLAIKQFRAAVELNPLYSHAHKNLGIALQDEGELDEAILCFEKAIQTDPNHEIGKKELSKARELQANSKKFQAYQKGDYTPKTNQDRLGLVEAAQVKKDHPTIVALYKEAFAQNPSLEQDWKSGHRFQASCAAVMAGFKPNKLNDSLVEKESLRKQAFTWLRAELDRLTQTIKSQNTESQMDALNCLSVWVKCKDLSAIHDKKELEKLKPEEKALWKDLWLDVQKTLSFKEKSNQ